MFFLFQNIAFMIQGIVLSDDYWLTFSHSYTAVCKRRSILLKKNRSCGLRVGYHHRIFIKPNDLELCRINLSN